MKEATVQSEHDPFVFEEVNQQATLGLVRQTSSALQTGSPKSRLPGRLLRDLGEDGPHAGPALHVLCTNPPEPEAMERHEQTFRRTLRRPLLCRVRETNLGGVAAL